MCGPVATVALMVAGTFAKSRAQRNQGVAAQREADYRSSISKNNAIIASQNAELALDKGRADVRDQRRKTAQRIGLQRAQLAAQGFDVSEGTSVGMLGDTAAVGELDALRLKVDSEQRARNFRSQSSNFEAEAGLHTFSGQNARAAGKAAANATLLEGAAKIGSYVSSQASAGAGG